MEWNFCLELKHIVNKANSLSFVSWLISSEIKLKIFDERCLKF